MWAAAAPGLQPEVDLPDLQPPAGVDYLQAQESGKPERRNVFLKPVIVFMFKNGINYFLHFDSFFLNTILNRKQSVVVYKELCEIRPYKDFSG